MNASTRLLDSLAASSAGDWQVAVQRSKSAITYASRRGNRTGHETGELPHHEGRPIQASIAKRLLAEVVRLEDHEGAEPRPDELRASLLRLLARVEDALKATHTHMSLVELLDRALKYKTR
jgi:hypothetical protein